MAEDDVLNIRELVKQHRYSLKQHAHQRMMEREIFTDDVESVVLLGDLVEENPKNYPCPTNTFMRFVRGEPLYAVCALTPQWVYIITVHWMDPDKWVDPWTRKK